jgi:hypothetical protein
MKTCYKFYPYCLFVLWLLSFDLIAGPLFAEPLFDAHLHYSAADAKVLSPKAVIERLDRNGIRYAVVSSAPASHTNDLYNYAPDRIVPLLGIYHSQDDKVSWTDDASLSSFVETEINRGAWRGVGELHVFAKDRHKPVFRRIVEIVSSRQLPILIHGDPAVIDSVYDIAPSTRLIWAHAGTFPYPDLIADYLQRYPALIVDLSMRDERIAPQGILDDAWYELFVTYPNRFVVGVDTYSQSRWQEFDAAVVRINNWLSQLPDDVAKQLAYDNAARIYSK